MRNLTTMFLVLFMYFIVSLSSTVFAQSEKVQQIPPVKDELRENYSQGNYKNFLLMEKLGEIPFQGGIVDQIAGTDALVNNNTGSTGTSNFTQSETSILAFGSTVLIGFNDSGSFVGGANKFTGFSYSTDGGSTFTDGGTLPTSGIGDAGDPVLAMDESTGRIYFSTLGFSGPGTIQVFRSDDGGVTWMAPVSGTPGGGSEDKQWIAVDNFGGTGNGNVYLMSRNFGSGNGIYMYKSTDNGATFGPSGGTNIVSGKQGAFVVVGPDHSVYAFWYDGATIKMRKSTDQAVTFGSSVTVASGLTGGINGDLGLTGIRQGTASPSSFRSNEFPHAAVNPVSGDLYCTFANIPAGSDKADVYMVMSTDGGTTWSAAVRVNDDATTTDQWQPTIAVTPNGSRIGIFYYSREEDTGGNNLFKYYGRIGVISGSTVIFSPSFAVSDVASLPEFGRDAVVNSVYMGDYNHVAATNDKFHVVWSDNRDDLPGGGVRKDPNVYYEFIVLGPAQPPDISVSPTSFTFNVPEGGSDSDILTIFNTAPAGSQDLNWNISEQEVILVMEDGRMLPVNVQLSSSNFSNDITSSSYKKGIYAPSAGLPPLDGYANSNVTNNSSINSFLVGTDAFATETQTSQFMQFDLGVPEILNSISAFTDIVWAGDFGTDQSFAYGVNSVTNQFVQINVLTGAETVIGPCAPTQNPGGGEIFTGMAIDPTSGVVYLSSTDLITSWLYTVNTATGAPTLVGVLTNAPAMIGIAIDNSGQMYGYEIIADVMLSINKANGAGTVLGPLGYDANFGQGMDFDPVTGTLYLTAFNNSTFQAELRTGNTTTGNTTFVGVLGSTSPGGLVQLGWVGIPGEAFDCLWLAENPTNGTIPAGSSQNVDILVDATGLSAGTYNCNLLINSNDPVDPTVNVPVTLNVTSGTPPDINVVPTSFTFNVPEGGSDSDILTIFNTAPSGAQNLNWNLLEQEALLKLDNGESIKVSIKGNNIVKDWLDNFNINEWREKYKNVSRLSDVLSNLIVTNPGNPDALGDILDSFTAPGTASTIGVTYDPGLDAVWIVDELGGQVFLVEKTPPYSILQTLILPPLTTNMGPDDIAVVGNTLYISDFAGDAATFDDLIYAVDKTTGVLIDYWELDGPGNPNPSDFIDQIIGLTVNGSGEFFASNNVDNIIRKIDLQPGGNWQTLQTYTSPTGGPTAGLYWDPLQNGFWVANIIGAPMFLTDPNFVILNSFTAPGPASSGITSIFNGNLWVSDIGTGLIYVVEGLPIPDCPWLSENPISGTVPPGGFQEVDIIVDATGLAVGTYNCNLLINSNDPVDPTVTVPVELNVLPSVVTDFAVDFLVFDNCVGSINIVFGTAPGATECYDPGLDQFAPPPPPSGAFDGRFISCADGLLIDFKAPNPDGVRIWDVHYQPANGCEPVSFSWDPGQLPPDGNFTLIDFPTGGDLVNVDMRTNSVYTDPLGLGHLQIVFNYEVCVNFDFVDGWNMLGLPLVVPDDNYLTLFPSAIPGTLFGYSGGYFSTTTVGTCTGYWLKFPATEIVEVCGLEITECIINLTTGWNMIGGPNCSVPLGSVGDPGGVIIPGTLFGYAGGYFSATSIDATLGYWIKASAPGTITIGCGALLAKGGNDLTLPLETLTDFGKIDISDAGNKGQTLYFNGKLDEGISIESYSMPPVAPKGSFDARLTGGYRLSESAELTIQVQSSHYPVSITITDIKYEVGYGYVLQEIDGGVEVGSHNIVDGVKIVISNENVSLLKITKQEALPTSFALAQNYPNPFNPSTMINYDLPETRNVTLVIYNALGEKVRTLVSGMQDAGYYSVLWDSKNDSGSKVGSGMYIYALRAGDYYSVKKMMLLK